MKPQMSNVDIDQTLVHSLLRDQHLDLVGLSIRRVAGGWDNPVPNGVMARAEDVWQEAISAPDWDYAPVLMETPARSVTSRVNTMAFLGHSQDRRKQLREPR